MVGGERGGGCAGDFDGVHHEVRADENMIETEEGIDRREGRLRLEAGDADLGIAQALELAEDRRLGPGVEIPAEDHGLLGRDAAEPLYRIWNRFELGFVYSVGTPFRLTA